MLQSAVFELIQVAGLLTLLLVTWHRHLPVTHGVCAWCALALSFDVFVWHCQRPTIIMEGVNAAHVLLSLGVLYENCKEACRAILVFCLSVFK